MTANGISPACWPARPMLSRPGCGRGGFPTGRTRRTPTAWSGRATGTRRATCYAGVGDGQVQADPAGAGDRAGREPGGVQFGVGLERAAEGADAGERRRRVGVHLEPVGLAGGQYGRAEQAELDGVPDRDEPEQAAGGGVPPRDGVVRPGGRVQPASVELGSAAGSTAWSVGAVAQPTGRGSGVIK